MSEKTTINNNGIGFCGLLTILFITLKLCGVITWSWFWVVSPLLFSLVVFGLVLVIFIVIGVFIKVLS